MTRKWAILLAISILLMASISLVRAEEAPKEHSIMDDDYFNTYYSFKWDKDQNQVLVKYSKTGILSDGDGGQWRPVSGAGKHQNWGDFDSAELIIATNIGNARFEKEMLQKIKEELETEGTYLTKSFEGDTYPYDEGRRIIQGYLDATSGTNSASPASASPVQGSSTTPTTYGAQATGAPYTNGALVPVTDPDTGARSGFTVVSSRTQNGIYYYDLKGPDGTVYQDSLVYSDGTVRLWFQSAADEPYQKKDYRLRVLDSSAPGAPYPNGASIPVTDPTTGTESAFTVVGSRMENNIYYYNLKAPDGTLYEDSLVYSDGTVRLWFQSAADEPYQTRDYALRTVVSVPGDILYRIGPGGTSVAGAPVKVLPRIVYAYKDPQGGIVVSEKDTLNGLKGIPLTEQQSTLLQQQGATAASVRLDGSRITVVQEKKTGTQVTETTTFTLASGGSIQKEVKRGKDAATLIAVYTIDDKGKETLQSIKDRAGQDAPFVSEQFTLNDKGNWLYDGREGKLVQDAANGDRFEFPDGSYVQKIGDTLIEKRVEGNKISFVLTKDGKEFTVPENLLFTTFKDLSSKKSYVANLPEYLDILKNNRFKQEDFRPSPDGKLVSADNSMRISFDGTNYLIQLLL